ncbi:hypothetical protein [Vibrio sonorensis]|uniref:hypothetical protein n=1 Tax=Vibrio sonorensis TaxID=1004316 RepID=UPI0011145C5D|nr:hypothetical protein [Vibrio sonorensis]
MSSDKGGKSHPFSFLLFFVDSSLITAYSIPSLDDLLAVSVCMVEMGLKHVNSGLVQQVHRKSAFFSSFDAFNG